MDISVLNASGKRVINIDLKRHKQGIKVKVKVDPEVEEFFKHWGGGVAQFPQHGRMWKNVDDSRPQLWSFDHQLQENGNYSLYFTGSNLINDGQVNLSFLRLVGASEGQQFIIDTVIGRDELEKVAAKLRKAAEHFYTEYIQQVHMNIFVGVRDVSRGEV